MKKLIIIAFTAISSTFYSQTFIQAYQDRANQISQANINANLQSLEGFGVKTTGSANNNNAFNWLKSKYQSFGYANTQIEEQTFTYNGNSSKNLIVTKTGTLYPNTFVIVCGHYDTVVGPGVNDNGSGVSIILEAARILKDISTQYSIKFIHFSGEEQGLLGSQAYVNNVVNATTPKMDIRLVLNLDQVGGIAGQSSNTIKCEKDASMPASNDAASATKTQELMNCVTLYSPLQPILSNAYSSDYMPFQSNDEVITGLFETPESTRPHTAADTFANMDPTYVFKVGKATIGALQHFAVASSQLGVNEAEKANLKFSVVPNPAKDKIVLHFDSKNPRFEFTLSDVSGKKILTSENQKEINISHLENGVYLGVLKINENIYSEKIIVNR